MTYRRRAPCPTYPALTVAIIGGTGDQGRGLAYRFARAGQRVLIGSRVAERAAAAAGGDLRAARRDGAPVEGGDNADVSAAADVVIVAVPWEGHARHRRVAARRRSRGKVVVDCVNPLGFDKQRPVRAAGARGQRRAAGGGAAARVAGVRGVPPRQRAAADRPGGRADRPRRAGLADDREAAGSRRRRWPPRIPGMRGIYAGRLRNADQVEAFTANLIAINRRYKAHAGIRVTDLLISDDLGDRRPAGRPPRRVVSLVPSLTEAVAATRAGAAGRRHRLLHAPGRPGRGAGRRHEVPRRGRACSAAEPDLVLANAEENRREDVDALRAAGVPVWVTYPRDARRGARSSLGRLLRRCSAPDRSAVAGRRPRGVVGAASPRPPAPGGGPGLAPAVGGAGRRHLRRRPARAASASTTCTPTAPERYPAPAAATAAAQRAERGPGRAARRAVRVHRRRRAGGVPRPAVRAGLRPPPDLVRPVARRPRRAVLVGAALGPRVRSVKVCSAAGNSPPRTSSANCRVASVSTPARSAYRLTKRGAARCAARPCPARPAPARRCPGRRRCRSSGSAARAVIRLATSPGTISSTTANAPASATACASASTSSAASPRPCTR